MGILGSLGSLNVLLSADTAQFSSAMDKAAYQAERDLRRISTTAKINGAIIATAVVAAGTAFAVSIKKVIDRADEMNKLSQSLGMTTEELSKLKYAAEISGVSLEELETAVARMSKEAVKNSSTLRMLGIAVEDSNGKFKSGYDMLTSFADAISRMPDGMAKTSIITEVLGRSAAKLAPLLNNGSDGLKKLGEEAKRLGIVIDSDTARASERFNDSMLRMSKAVEGALTSFTAGFIPTMADLSESIINSKNALADFSDVGAATAKVIVALAGFGAVLSTTFMTLADVLAAGVGEMNLLLHGKFKEFADLDKATKDDIQKRWDNLGQGLSKNWDIITDKATASSQKISESTTHQVHEITKETEDDFKRIENMSKGIGNAFGKAFDAAILEGAKFHDVMISLLQDVEAAIFKSLISQRLADAVSTGISSFFNLKKPSAHGNVFSEGNLIPYANGGLIPRRTLFPMANGAIGMAGESGAEAILPLFRTGRGDLGVKAGGGGGVEVNVFAPPGSNVKQNRQSSGDKEIINIMIDEAAAGAVGNPGSKTYKALRNTFGLKQALTTR